MFYFTHSGQAQQLQWVQRTRIMTQDELPVLTYELSFPQLSHPGLAGKWINRCHLHLAQVWQRRWEQTVYPRACAAQTYCLAHSTPFMPWKCSLTGEVIHHEDSLLALRFTALEQHNYSPFRLMWEDHWNLRTGAPIPKNAPKNAFKKISDFFKKRG